jgi:hypothetical protein
MADRNVLLDLLRRLYGDRWHIRRTEHLWIAVARDPDPPHARSLVEPDAELFVSQLEKPPPGAGRSLLSSDWCRTQLQPVEGRDGMYVSRHPPMT